MISPWIKGLFYGLKKSRVKVKLLLRQKKIQWAVSVSRLKQLKVWRFQTFFCVSNGFFLSPLNAQCGKGDQRTWFCAKNNSRHVKWFSFFNYNKQNFILSEIQMIIYDVKRNSKEFWCIWLPKSKNSIWQQHLNFAV